MRNFNIPTHVNLTQTYAPDIAFKVEQYRIQNRYAGKLYLAGDAWRAIQPVQLNAFNSHHFGQLSYIFVTADDLSLIGSNLDILIDTADGRVIYAPGYTDIATHENDFKTFITTDVIISYHLDQTIQRAYQGHRISIDRLAGTLLSYRIPLLGIHKKLDHGTAEHLYALTQDSKYVPLHVELGRRGLSPDYLSALMHCALLTIKDARKKESTDQLNRVIDGHLQTIKTLTDAPKQAQPIPAAAIADRDARIAALEKALEAEQKYNDELRARQVEMIHTYEEKLFPASDALLKMNDELTQANDTLTKDNKLLRSKSNELQDERRSLLSQLPRLENALAFAQNDTRQLKNQVQMLQGTQQVLQDEAQALKGAQQPLKNRNKMLQDENTTLVKQRDAALSDAEATNDALKAARDEVIKVKAELELAYATQKKMDLAHQKPSETAETQTNTISTTTTATQTVWDGESPVTPISSKPPLSPMSDLIGTPAHATPTKKKKNKKPKQGGGESSSSSGALFEAEQLSVPPSPIGTSTGNPSMNNLSITNHGNTMELMLDTPFSPNQKTPYVPQPGDEIKQAIVTYVTIEMPANHGGKKVDLSTEMINMLDRVKITPPTEPIQQLMKIIPDLPDVNASMIFILLVIWYIAQLHPLKSAIDLHTLQKIIFELDQNYCNLCAQIGQTPRSSARLNHHESALHLIQEAPADAIETGAQPQATAALLIFRSGEGKGRKAILKALIQEEKKWNPLYL